MIIGVDAAALSVSDERLKVGVFRVIRHVLEELGTLDSTHQYRLYSFDPIHAALLQSFGGQMENRVLWPVRGWSKVRLPLELKLHPVDVFLGASQMVPRCAGNAIGFIYDVGFLSRPESYPGSRTSLVRQTEALARRSKRIITISQSVRDDIVRHYSVNASNVTVAYPGVDMSYSAVGSVYRGKRPYLLFVGALKPGKNTPGLIRIFARYLKKTNHEHDLYVVGGDYWKDPLIDQSIQENQLGGRVKLFGHVPDDELPALYRGAIAFVSASFHEGFCLPIVEAMASGCPVIGSDHGAVSEIVGHAGILVNLNDMEDVVRAMCSVADEPNKRTILMRQGKKRAANFSWARMARVVYEVIT